MQQDKPCLVDPQLATLVSSTLPSALAAALRAIWPCVCSWEEQQPSLSSSSQPTWLGLSPCPHPLSLLLLAGPSCWAQLLPQQSAGAQHRTLCCGPGQGFLPSSSSFLSLWQWRSLPPPHVSHNMTRNHQQSIMVLVATSQQEEQQQQGKGCCEPALLVSCSGSPPAC